MDNNDEMRPIQSADELWKILESCQGQTFYTMKKLPFTYVIKGGEMFVDRKKKSITKATCSAAWEKVQADQEQVITGPKKLNCFGAPYLWALFLALNVVSPAKTTTALEG
ncbi:MAG: hypothetical protein Q4C66_01305 [Lachnospiraceae bacterium]|nr:hypothetical protein [Lachnospiraceae bacterium]